MTAIPIGFISRYRPKRPGLWLELTYHDGATMEAILTDSLLKFDPNRITVCVLGGRTGRFLPEIGVPRCVLANIRVLELIAKKQYKQT